VKHLVGWISIALAGAAVLALVLPPLGIAQPRGLAITRGEARRIADAEVRTLGVDISRTWPMLRWEPSDILEKELASDPARRRAADSDPVVGQRLGAFHVYYFRRGLEKNPEKAYVEVGRRGEILSARIKARNEEPAPAADLAVLRRRADAFVATHALPGSPAPVFDSVRPTVLGKRVDTTFRYRVATKFPTGRVAFYLHVTFIGDRFAGFEQIEEYADGSRFRYETGGNLASFFLELGTIFLLLFVLLVRFLRKYHAGEVGVAGGTVLFATMLMLAFVLDVLICEGSSISNGFGGIDARVTAIANGAFRLFFYDVPFAVLVFLAWSVGESDARERWGHRLASDDALVRGDAFNATVGRSTLFGLLAGPAVAACTLVPPALAVRFGAAQASLGDSSAAVLMAAGGPFALVVFAAISAVAVPIVGILSPLAPLARRRLLPLGLLITAAIGVTLEALRPPIEPVLPRLLLSAGGILAAAAVFLAADVLAAAVSIFSGTLLVGLLPLVSAQAGAARGQSLTALLVPHILLLAFAAAALATRREVVYAYEDLAPHVKRIVERERVKAEIDAANRIQAALLPTGDPAISGTSVSSHYRAATEIGGDYFDFLLFPNDTLGLAFGDVSGHGLTSGIVMAMAKSALLVQIGYDASPARVLQVLNDIVMKTAPKRILMTFFFGLLDTESGVLRYASAGHLDPYVFRTKSRRLEPLSAWGFPLGVRRREPFREAEARLEPGDRLVLYSDGLIEAVDDDGEPFGFARFEAILTEHGEKSAQEIKNALLGSLRRFTRNRPPEDDQTLVVLSFEGRASIAA
jgi:serine phosphatase RsbU (regulator of sigma subunit)